MHRLGFCEPSRKVAQHSEQLLQSLSEGAAALLLFQTLRHALKAHFAAGFQVYVLASCSVYKEEGSFELR
jgi:exonuclease VII large subunit